MSKSRAISVAAVSLLAYLVLSTGPAFAEETGPKVKLSTAKGALASGQSIVAFSSNLVFTTSGGNEECTENTLSGSMSTNSKETIAGEVTELAMTGTGGGLCNTTTPLGKDEITGLNLPWKIKLAKTGVFQMTSSNGDKTITIEHVYPEAGGAHCAYESKKVLGSFPVNTTPVPLAITWTNQVFKLKAGSTAGCVTEGKYTGTFSTTSKGEQVMVEVK